MEGSFGTRRGSDQDRKIYANVVWHVCGPKLCQLIDGEDTFPPGPFRQPYKGDRPINFLIVPSPVDGSPDGSEGSFDRTGAVTGHLHCAHYVVLRAKRQFPNGHPFRKMSQHHCQADPLRCGANYVSAVLFVVAKEDFGDRDAAWVRPVCRDAAGDPFREFAFGDPKIVSAERCSPRLSFSWVKPRAVPHGAPGSLTEPVAGKVSGAGGLS